MKKISIGILVILFAFSCKNEKKNVQEEKQKEVSDKVIIDDIVESVDTHSTKQITEPEQKDKPVKVNEKVDDSKKKVDDNFSELTSKDNIGLDIKYATKDNFTKKQIYPCGKCYLRPEAATALRKANSILKAKYKYYFKMFDCYRPRPAQQRLWDVVPNPDYVTPPSKGSMHNRGLAVDLTIVDEAGNELDMGTPYDYFGKEAHTDNMNLPKKVLENRKLLRDVMEEVGFRGIRTEWWHFSYDKVPGALADWEWPCN